MGLKLWSEGIWGGGSAKYARNFFGLLKMQILESVKYARIILAFFFQNTS